MALVTSSLARIGDRRGARAEAPVARLLELAMQHQREPNWCWAAVGTSVGLFFHSGRWTQCATASACLDLEVDCCAEAPACNEYGYVDKALAHTRSFASKRKGRATATEIRREIDARRPVVVRVEWTAGGAHFLAITAYSHPGSDPDELFITLDDSIYAHSVMKLAEFPAHYHDGGAWTHVYFTEREG